MYDEDLKCREANLTFWNVGFPLIFGTFLLVFEMFWNFLAIVGRRDPEMRSFSNSQGSKVVVLVLFLGLGNVVINHSGFGMLDVMINTYSVFKLTTKSEKLDF